MKWRNCCGYELGGGSQHVNEAAVNAMMKSAYGKIESTHGFKTQRNSEDQGEMRNRHRMQRWHGSATAKEMLMS
jgi:hypothetical protein